MWQAAAVGGVLLVVRVGEVVTHAVQFGVEGRLVSNFDWLRVRLAFVEEIGLGSVSWGESVPNLGAGVADCELDLGVMCG